MFSPINETVGCIVTWSIALLTLHFLFRRFFLERYYDRIEGRVVVITGCDSGFGYDTAIRLVEKSAIVIAGCYMEESLTALKDAVGPLGDRMVTLPLHLEDDDSVDAFIASIKTFLVEKNLKLYGLVNNAGVFSAGPAEWISREHMRRLFAVNAVGAMHLSNKLAPLLHEGKGRLVAITSVSALVHGGQLAIYGATKAALDNYLSSVKVESQRDYSVHIVHPGGFRTRLLNPDALRANITANWTRAPKEVQNDFGSDYYETFMDNWAEGVTKYANSRPAWVAETVEHALFGTYPRDRYWVGWDSMFLFAPLSFSPTWWQDRLLKRFNARFFLRQGGGQVKMALFNDGYEPLSGDYRAAG